MGIKVGVLGVGPVGEHIIRVLGERRFPVDGDIIIMATREREEVLNGQQVTVRKVSEDLLRKLDLVFRGKGGRQGASMEWADIAVKLGCTVIDNGSICGCIRMSRS